MRLIARFGSPKRRGVALVYATFGAFVAASSVAVFLTFSMSSNRTSGITRHRMRASYLADGALGAAKKDVQESIANWEVPEPDGSVTLADVLVNYTVQPTGFADVRTDTAGIQTIVTGYELEARAVDQGHTAVARRIINAEATPLFQFAVFYTGDLEINPGPDMTLAGRIHSNGDIYLNSGNTLTCDTNYLHAVGDLYRRRKDNPSASTGEVLVRRWVENPFDPFEPVEYVEMLGHDGLNALGVPNVSGYDSDFVDGWDYEGDGDYFGADDWLPWGPGALDLWSEPDSYVNGSGNTVLTAAHGIGEAVTPYIGSIQMFEEANGGDYAWDPIASEYAPVTSGTGTHNPGYYHGEADLSILVHDDGTWTATDGSGTNVTSALQGANVVTVTDIYDARQASGAEGSVPIIEIDMTALGASGVWPSNGLLYASHYGLGTGTDAKGVLLSNGAELAGAMTVVSEGPLYIEGDYNTVDKKGAAVIGDAINLLSNAWDGTKGSGSGLPDASDTTYNCAMISGNQDTAVGKYNGGLENLPRFHEAWSGKTCAISGSFVNAWNSSYATGEWVYGGNRYKAPRRLWNYDSAFNNVAGLPPFTPMAVSARDVVSW